MDASENPGETPAPPDGPGGGPGGGLGAELRLSVAFLTRLPTETVGEAGIAAAVWAFPVVGAALGLAGGLAYLGAAALGLPALAAAYIAIGVVILATGALHEDGLADLADGLGGGRDRAAKLAIMRDSRIGAYGALALVLVVGLKAVALAAIGGAGPLAAMAALAATGAASRGAMPLVMLQLPPARADGLGADAGRPKPVAAGVAVILALALAASLLGAYGWPAVVLALAVGALAAGAIAALAARQLGGHTGDVLGAVQQAAETAMLLALSALLAP